MRKACAYLVLIGLLPQGAGAVYVSRSPADHQTSPKQAPRKSTPQAKITSKTANAADKAGTSSGMTASAGKQTTDFRRVENALLSKYLGHTDISNLPKIVRKAREAALSAYSQDDPEESKRQSKRYMRKLIKHLDNVADKNGALLQIYQASYKGGDQEARRKQRKALGLDKAIERNALLRIRKGKARL